MEAPCLDLLNSDLYDYRGDGRLVEDRLGQPRWLEDFLRRWNFEMEPTSQQEGPDVLRPLRSQLRSCVECLNRGQDLSEEDLAVLSDFLRAVPRCRSLVRNGKTYVLQEEPLQKDWSWIEAEIVASFAELLSQYDPLRLKMCENPQCRWIYYDESPNHTRRWCQDTCANMMRVRRFREKQREQLNL